MTFELKVGDNKQEMFSYSKILKSEKRSEFEIKFHIFGADASNLQFEMFLKIEKDLYHGNFNVKQFPQGGAYDSWENVLERICHFPHHVNVHCTGHYITLIYESFTNEDFQLQLDWIVEDSNILQKILSIPITDKDETNLIAQLLAKYGWKSLK